VAISDNSNDDKLERQIEAIGTGEAFQKQKERTFLQRREKQKKEFMEKMARWKKQDVVKKMRDENLDQKHLTYQEKMALEMKPVVESEQWENDLWADVAQDASGNIIRLKQA